MSDQTIYKAVPYEYEVKSKGNQITLAGYVSTKDIDYSNEVCTPQSWVKRLQAYKNNPLYCYNHDKSYPIGLVGNVSVDDKGLYIDDINIQMNIPVVKDYLQYMILDGIITQQSAGFYSYEQEVDKKTGILYHLDSLLVESSLVPIACNRHATARQKSLVIETIDSVAQYETMKDLMNAHSLGLLDRTKQHFVPDTYEVEPKNINDQNTGQNVDNKMAQYKITATKHLTESYDPAGTPVTKPEKYKSNYHSVAENIYAAYKQIDEDVTSRSYVFQIANPTEKGFDYDFNLVSFAVCKVLGGRNGEVIEPEVKSAIINRLSDAYATLEKDFPVYEKTGEPLNKMADWKLKDINFSEVKFLNDENTLFEAKQFESDVKSIQAFLKKGSVPTEMVKDLYGSVSVSLYSSVNDPDTIDFMQTVISSIVAYQNAESTEPADSGMGYYDMSFVKWLDSNETKRGQVKSVKDKTMTVEIWDIEDNATFKPSGKEVEVSIESENVSKTSSLEKYNVLTLLQATVDANKEKLVKSIEDIKVKTPVKISEFAQNLITFDDF